MEIDVYKDLEATMNMVMFLEAKVLAFETVISTFPKHIQQLYMNEVDANLQRFSQSNPVLDKLIEKNRERNQYTFNRK